MGPGKSVGAVTQMRYANPPYISAIPLYFTRVGLFFLPILFSGDVATQKTSDRMI